MGTDSALELLSPELQQAILLHLDDLDTLYALIRASPRFHQVFRLNKDSTLTTITLCQFHPAVRPEALAVATLEQIQSQSQRDAQSQRDTAVRLCETFPSGIHLWCQSNPLETVSTYLCKLHRDINFFIDDYTRNTLPILHQLGQSQDYQILSEYPPYNDTFYSPLSSTEIARLQRAFCRFELYRLLFSRCSHDIHNGIHKCIRVSPLKPEEQATEFFRDLPAFQITEISCVRDYLYRRLRGIWNQLEDDAVHTLPLKEMAFEDYDEAARWRSPLYLFTTQALPVQEEHLEHLLSLGLPYVRRILKSSGDG